MSPVFTPKLRKLVLGRETVRALTGPRGNTLAEATLDGRATSCGVDCGCTGFMQAR
ncbi:MAG TPA: hypothetical protein VF615_07250 [Longimicrobiaceae bacterium]|jgi:hypothetical protein